MNASLARIGAVAHIEWLRLLRARTTFTLLLLVPAMQVLLFGYAIQPTATTITVAIAADNPASAARVADVLRSQAGLTVGAMLAPGEAATAVRRGTALVGIEVPPAASLASMFGARLPLRVIVDATNPVLTTAVVPRIEAAYWHAVAAQAHASGAPMLTVERLFNPHERADWSFLPALIGVVMMISSIMLGSLSLAREREIGTWEALLALPVSAFEVLVGKLLPYVVTGTAQGLVVIGAGVVVFDVPVRGSLSALVLLLPLFAAAHLALGYVIASRAATQLEALQGAVAFYLPAMLLSGFLYPAETLPGWARALGAIFPLTHLIRAARGAMLRGDGAPAVLLHALPIALFLAVMLVLLRLLRRRVD